MCMRTDLSRISFFAVSLRVRWNVPSQPLDNSFCPEGISTGAAVVGMVEGSFDVERRVVFRVVNSVTGMVVWTSDDIYGEGNPFY